MFGELENDDEPQTRRRKKYDINKIVSAASQAYDIPEDLLHGIIEQESRGNPKVVSPAGAIGLMQLMPGTAKQMGVSDPTNPIDNVFGGAKYFREQLDSFDGDVDKALAAYNAGPGAVRKYGGVPPYKETRDYVPSVKARSQKYKKSMMERAVDYFVPSAEASEPLIPTALDVAGMTPDEEDSPSIKPHGFLEEFGAQAQEDNKSPWNYALPLVVPGLKAVGRASNAMWRGISEYLPNNIASSYFGHRAEDAEDPAEKQVFQKKSDQYRTSIADTIGAGFLNKEQHLRDLFPQKTIANHPYATSTFAGIMPFIADPTNLIPINIAGKGAAVEGASKELVNHVDDFADDFAKRGIGDFVDSTISASQAEDVAGKFGGGIMKEAPQPAIENSMELIKAPEVDVGSMIRPNADIAPIGINQGPIGGIPPVAEPTVNEYIASQRELLKQAKSVERPGFFERAGNMWREFKKKMVDINAPIEDTISKMEKKYNFQMLPEERTDYSHMVDRVYRSPELANQFMSERVMPQPGAKDLTIYNPDVKPGQLKADPSLIDIIKRVDDYGEFNEFLKSVRMVQNSYVDPKFATALGRSIDMDKKVFQELYGKYADMAGPVFRYTRRLKQYAVDSGLISEELSKHLDDLYPYYVPANRVQDAIDFSHFHGNAAPASISQQTAFQKLVGSERVIEDPLESLVEKTNAVFAQAERNKAAQALVGLKDIPYFKDLFVELKPGQTGKHTVSFLDKGVKRVFETTPEFEAAAKNLNHQQLGTIMRIFALPVRAFKLGTTGINPAFTAANVAKDTIFSSITSPAHSGSLANPMNWLRNFSRTMGSSGKALWHSVFHGALYDDMVRAGAGGTIFDTARGSGAKTVTEIRSMRGIMPRVKYVATHPSQLLRWVEDVVGTAEQFNRLRNFDRVKSQLLSNGVNMEHATVLAAKASRDSTINFYRRGEWGSALNSIWAYMNAGIQGTRTFMRAMKNAPIRTAARMATNVFLPVAAVTAWNMKDDKRRKAYLDIEDYVRENNIVLFPPGDPEKDEQGNWKAITIPLPPGVSNLSSIVRRFVEQAYDGDPVNAEEMGRHLLGTVNPAGSTWQEMASFAIPQAVKPPMQWMANYDFWRRKPIIPQHMTELPPEMQKFDYTSGTATKVANLLDVPPIKVEKLAYDIFGSVTSQALHYSDIALSKAGVIQDSEIQGRPTGESIAARFTSAKGGKQDRLETERLSGYETEQAGLRYARNHSAKILAEKLGSSDQAIRDSARQEARDLKASDPVAYKATKRAFDESQKGVAMHDRKLRGLSVKDGLRAKAIMERWQSMESSQDKLQYLNDLKKKGILNKVVYKQMEMLQEE